MFRVLRSVTFRSKGRTTKLVAGELNPLEGVDAVGRAWLKMNRYVEDATGAVAGAETPEALLAPVEVRG